MKAIGEWYKVEWWISLILGVAGGECISKSTRRCSFGGPDHVAAGYHHGGDGGEPSAEQFKNSPKASAKVIFKNVGTNSTLTGGTKVKL